jgi:acyl carrier protein
MFTTLLSDADMSALLIAVGVESPADPHIFDSSFEELEIDSLGRTELATRVADRFGVDVEEDLLPETTPNELRLIVAKGIQK